MTEQTPPNAPATVDAPPVAVPLTLGDVFRTLVTAHPWFSEAEARAALAVIERDAPALVQLVAHVITDPGVDAAASALAAAAGWPSVSGVIDQAAAVLEPPAPVEVLPGQAEVAAAAVHPENVPAPVAPLPDAAPVDPATVDSSTVDAPATTPEASPAVVAPDAGTAATAGAAVPAFVEPGAPADTPAPTGDVTA